MPRLHENTTFDADAEAVALVSRLEAEALDEVQVADALQQIITTLASRQQAAVQRVNEEVNRRVEDNRRDLLKAKAKGVKPIIPTLPGGNKLVLPDAPVIPIKAVR